MEILHVVQPPESQTFGPPAHNVDAADIRARIRNEDEPEAVLERLLEYASVDLNSSGVELRLNQRQGTDVAELIVDQAHAATATYIVLGTHLHSPFHRLLVGGVVSNVVRFADCPVLVVPHDVESGAGFEAGKVVVPLDFSSGSTDQIQAAARLALCMHLELELFHVIEPFTLPVSLTGFRTIYELVPDIDQRVRDQMRAMAETIPGLPNEILYRTENGHAVATIVEESESEDTAALVIAAHGGRGLRRFFIGSVSERIIRGSHCPVLIVPVTHLAVYAELNADEDFAVV